MPVSNDQRIRREAARLKADKSAPLTQAELDEAAERLGLTRSEATWGGRGHTPLGGTRHEGRRQFND